MDVTIIAFCHACHRECRMPIKLGVTTKELEENYPCIHCRVKGKLKRIGI